MTRSTKKLDTVSHRLRRREIAELIGDTEMTHNPSTDEERATSLDDTVWSYDFTWQEIKVIAGFMHTFQVAKDHKIFEEHSEESYMCLVVNGAVAVLKLDSTDGEKIVTNLGRGRTFGEMSIVDARPRSATIRATTPTEVLLLTRRGLDRLIMESPHLGARFCLRIASVISQRLRRTSGLLVDYLAD